MSERIRTDHATLWSSVVATVITLSLGSGRFDWLCLALGTAQSLQLGAYYRPAPRPAGDRWGRLAAAGAFGAACGLVAVMLLSWPVQTAVGTPAECRELAALGGAAVHDCAGYAAYRWLGPVWGTAGAALAWWHWRTFVLPERPPDAGGSAPRCTGALSAPGRRVRR